MIRKIFKSFCLFVSLCVLVYGGIVLYRGDEYLILEKIQTFSILKDDLKEGEYLLAGSKKVNNTFRFTLNKEGNSEYEDLFQDVLQRVKIGYVEEVKEKDLIESAINGMLSSLDPHSGYMSKEDFDEMQVQTRGEFGGLGIEITMENSLVKIISPIEGTPAFRAGLKSGDYISHIDDKSVVGMSLIDAVKLMRGKPGTRVKINILRKSEKKPLEFKIKRDIIKIRAVRAHREGDIIYVKLNSFTEQTYGEMIKELTRIENLIGKKRVKGMVLDLRGNPGGLLDQAVLVSEAFLDKDQVIVSIKGRGGEELNKYTDRKNQDLIPNTPMVVLINEGSASASEIVAGALQDNGRAMVMGVKSFGKGSVQSVTPVHKGGAIRMTIARYYTPLGRPIQAEGVEPDIIVKDAKIETVDSKWVSKESSLKGHLKSEKKKRRKKKQLSTDNQDLYEKDYQLARAIDLLLGISFYQEVK